MFEHHEADQELFERARSAYFEVNSFPQAEGYEELLADRIDRLAELFGTERWGRFCEWMINDMSWAVEALRDSGCKAYDPEHADRLEIHIALFRKSLAIYRGESPPHALLKPSTRWRPGA
jgi:hypothetical protein